MVQMKHSQRRLNNFCYLWVWLLDHQQKITRNAFFKSASQKDFFLKEAEAYY